MGSYRAATFFVVLGFVQCFATGEPPTPTALQEIFTAKASALEQDFTLRYSVVIPPKVKPNGESETLRYHSVLTHKGGQFSVLMRLDPDTKPPVYPKNATNAAHFERDEAGNVLLWRDLERHIQADDKMQVRRNLLARLIVPSSGEAGFERDTVTAAQPSSRYVAHRQDPLHFFEVHQPLIAAGLGHFLYVKEITHVRAHNENSAFIYCEGLGKSPNATVVENRIWKMVLDPENGYLLKSVHIVSPDGETILSEIKNDGALADGETVISDSSVYTLSPAYLHLLRQQYAFSFNAFEAAACNETIRYISTSLNATEDGPSTMHVVEDPIFKTLHPQRMPKAHAEK